MRLVSTPDLISAVPSSIYLPNPVELEPFVTAGAGTPDRDVLVFAALTEVKGAEHLVAAVRALRSAAPDLRITAIGGGPYTGAMRDAGAAIVPRLYPAEIPTFIARHRVVLGQQRLGVLGVSELQAMAAGRPVITHVNADADYGPDRPPIAEAHDPADIAHTAERLLASESAAAMLGGSGANWVRRHHDRSAVARRLVEIYRTVVTLPDHEDGAHRST